MALKIKALQDWCKHMLEGYRDVSITNMTTSWRSGMAFCGLLHKMHPNLIDYDSLSKENVFENNQLAFEKGLEVGIPALLDAEDMVALKTPDRLSIITYVSQYYNHYRKLKQSGQLGKPVERTLSNRAAVKRPTPSEGSPPSHSKKPHNTQEAKKENDVKRGTIGDTCCICKQKVYLMERFQDKGKFYHRNCFREKQRSSISPTDKPNPFVFANKQNVDTSSNNNDKSKSYGLSPAFKATQLKNSPGFNRTEQVKPAAVKSEPVKSYAFNSPAPKVEKFEKAKPMKIVTDSPAPYKRFTDSDEDIKSSGLQTHEKMEVDDTPHWSKYKASGPQSNGHEPAKVSNLKVEPVKVSNMKTFEPATVSNLKTVTPASSASSASSVQPKSTFTSWQPKTNITDVKTNNKINGAPTKDVSATKDYKFTTNKTTLNTDSALNNKVPRSKSPAPVAPATESEPSWVKKAGNIATKYDFKGEVPKGDNKPTWANKVTTPEKKTEVKRPAFDSKDTKTVNTTNNRFNSTPSTNNTSKLNNTTGIYKTTKDSSASESSSLNSYATESSSVRSNVSESSSAKSSPDSYTFQTTKTNKADDNKTESTIVQGLFANLANIRKKGSADNNATDKKMTDVNTTTSATAKSVADKNRYVRPQKTNVRDTARQENKSPLAVPRSENRTPSPKPNLKSTGPGSTVTTTGSPKSILKLGANKQEKKELSSPKPILKSKLPDIEITRFGGDSSPKSILKKANNSSPRQGTSPPRPPPPVRKPNTDAHTSKPKSSHLNVNVNNLGKSEVKMDVVIGKPVNGNVGITKIETVEPKKSILKNKSEDGTRSTLHEEKSNKPEIHNNFSAFTINDSMDLINVQDSELEKKGVKKAPKSAWELEMEARGMRTNLQHEADSKTNKFKAPVKEEKPQWQVEAEKRQAARNGKYRDPEKEPVSKPKKRQAPPVPGQTYMGTGVNSAPSKPKDTSPEPDIFGRVDLERISDRSITRSPAFRVSPVSSPETPPRGIHNKSKPITSTGSPSIGARKKIIPDTDFSFHSVEGDSSPEASKKNVSHIQKRPLPAVPQTPDSEDDMVPKRRVNAEERVCTMEMASELEQLDFKLQSLEDEGRDLEKRIRLAYFNQRKKQRKQPKSCYSPPPSSTETDMDEDDLMVQWFELVNQKNELVRRESELMYRRKQQELEDLHEELEYELRCLISMPENEKSGSDKIREDALLKELVDTISQRNHIVDSIEEDRLRYMEEDKEIEEMINDKSFSNSKAAKKKKKKQKQKQKKNKKEKVEQGQEAIFYDSKM